MPRGEADSNASIRARTPGIAVRRYTVYYTHPREQRRTDATYIKLTRPFPAFSNYSDEPPQYGSAFTQQTAHPLPGVRVPFAVIMIFMCYALYKGLRADFREQVGQEGSEEVAAEPAGRAAKEPAS